MNFSAIILSAAIILMLIAPVYTPITIAGWVLVSLIDVLIKRKKVKVKLELVISGILYLFYVLGILWSENKAVGYFDLEVKMSLIIIPFVITLVRYELIQLKILIYAFLIGLLIGLTWVFSIAIFKYASGESFDQLFYTKLSPDIHPSYFNFYLNIASCILLIDYLKNSIQLFAKKWIYLVLIFLFSMCSIFLLSKIGIGTAVIIVLVLLYNWAREKKYLQIISVVVLGSTFVYGVYYKSNFAQGRATEFVEAMGDGPKDHYVYSTSLRMEIWKASWENFIENPWFGYGTGDVRDITQKKYIENAVRRAPDLQLNSHNQFLQTALGTGLLGLSALVALLLLPILRHKMNLFYGAALSVITGIFFMTESVLETQAGVVSFVIFFSLLNSIDIIYKDTEEANESS